MNSCQGDHGRSPQPDDGLSSDKLQSISNRILLSLPANTLSSLLPHLDSIELERGAVVKKVEEPIDHNYFVESGLISVIKTMRNGQVVEVGAIGNEGMTDPLSAFGIDRATLDTIVQISGSAYRIRSDILQQAAREDICLKDRLENYLRFSIRQLTQTSACNGLHSLDRRCCRWLLIADDCTQSNDIHLTHEFLAMMLGVLRPSVSLALGGLKRDGLIDHAHGSIKVKNRKALEKRSCECYQDVQTELNELFDHS